MLHKSREERIGKRVLSATLAATVAFATVGIYSFAPQAAAADHENTAFDFNFDAAWTRWKDMASKQSPIEAPYAGPDFNETVTLTADAGTTFFKPKYELMFGSRGTNELYDTLKNRMNDAPDQSKWSVHSGDPRTLTLRFSEPVLNPLYRVNFGAAFIGDPAPWGVFSWEDIRLKSIDGNPVERDTPTAARVHQRALYGVYKSDLTKEGLVPGDIQLDPAKYFKDRPDNVNRLGIADGSYGFVKERIQEVNGWVSELVFEVTPRALITDTLGTTVNRNVHFPNSGGQMLRVGVGAPINDIGVRKTVTPTDATEKDTLTWTVQVTNHKSSTVSSADGIEGYYLIDELPPNVDPASFTVIEKPAGVEQVKVDGRKVYFKKVATGYELLLSENEKRAEVVGGNRTATPVNILGRGQSEQYVFSAKITGKETCAPEEILNTVRVVPAFYDSNQGNNESSARVTYKCITPVNATTTAPQGEAQKSTDKADGDAGKTVAEMFPNIPSGTVYALEGANEQGNVVVPNVGSYSIDPTGVVTFQPLPKFSGEAPAATIVATTPGKGVYKATYTPTVTDHVVVQNSTTVGLQGDVQTSADKKPEAEVNGEKDAGKTRDEMFPNAPEGSTVAIEGADPQTGVKTVDGEGSYILNAENVVVFTPEKDFTGTATPINVVLTTPSNTSFTATYTPSVLEKDIEKVDATTVGEQGQPQKSSDKDDAADAGKTPAEMFPGAPKGSTYKLEGAKPDGTVDVLTPNGEPAGTYSIDDQGVVTFTPDPKFTGVAPAVTVILTTPGKNMPGVGQNTPKEYKATYTPTVIEAKIVAKPATTVGDQGVNQLSNDKNVAEGDEGLEPNEMFPVFPNNSTFALQGPEGETNTVTVEREGTYTLDEKTGVVTFAPDPKFTGEAKPVTIVLTTPEKKKYSATYTPTVKEKDLTTKPAATTGVQGAPQKSTDKETGDAGLEPNEMFPDFPYGSTFSLKDADPATGALVVPGEGTYTIDAETGIVTFNPDPKFVGTATPVTVQLTTPKKAVHEAAYTPTVTPGELEAVPATTVGNQGLPQTSADKDLPPANSTPEDAVDNGKTPDEMFPNAPYGSTYKLKDPADGVLKDTVSIDKVGTYTISDKGIVTFSPDPKFTGTAPAATVVLTRPETAGGGTVETTYTPTVLEAPVVSHPAATTGEQGVKQNAADKEDGDAGLTPEEMFPNAPYGSTFALKDPQTGNNVPSVKIEGQGTYEINPESGELTFTPVPDFTGVATPAKVVLTTPKGKEYVTTYTPTVTEAAPTAVDASTTGVQGEPQKSTDGENGKTPADMFPNAPRNSKVVLLDGDGHEANVVKIPGKGTYEISPAGVVTFTPDPSFVGTADPVTIQLTTPGGKKATATYTPTVSELTGVNATTTGVQGARQTSEDKEDGDQGKTPEEMFPGLPAASSFSLEGAATEGDNAGKVVVEGQGVYSIAENGVVTFTPEPNFKGEASPVTIVATTPRKVTVTATFTPTVTAIETKDSTSEGAKGETQKSAPGTEMFPNGPENATYTLEGSTDGTRLVVDGVGEYNVDPSTGVVTFTPTPDYVGTPEPVQVRATNPNGATAVANYTPTVTEKTVDPVDPGDKPKDEPFVSRTTGLKGETQHSNDKGEGDQGKTPEEMFPGVPVGTKYTLLLEGDNQQNTTIRVEGEGTYTVDPDTGIVTFEPEASFVGEAKGVLILATDPAGEVLLRTDGSEMTGMYIPTVTEKPAEKPDAGNDGDGSDNGSGNGGDGSGNGSGNGGDGSGNGSGNGGDGSGNGSGNGSDGSGNGTGNGGDTGNNTGSTTPNVADKDKGGSSETKGKSVTSTAPAPNKATSLASTGATAGGVGALVALFAAVGAGFVTLRRRRIEG